MNILYVLTTLEERAQTLEIETLFYASNRYDRLSYYFIILI